MRGDGSFQCQTCHTGLNHTDRVCWRCGGESITDERIQLRAFTDESQMLKGAAKASHTKKSGKRVSDSLGYISDSAKSWRCGAKDCKNGTLEEVEGTYDYKCIHCGMKYPEWQLMLSLNLSFRDPKEHALIAINTIREYLGYKKIEWEKA